MCTPPFYDSIQNGRQICIRKIKNIDFFYFQNLGQNIHNDVIHGAYQPL